MLNFLATDATVTLKEGFNAEAILKKMKEAEKKQRKADNQKSMQRRGRKGDLRKSKPLKTALMLP